MKKLTLTTCALTAASLISSAHALGLSPLQTGFFDYAPANVDGGGDVDKSFFHLSAGIPIQQLNEDLFVAITFSYQVTSYDFAGGPAGSFTARSPWHNAQTLNLGSYIEWSFRPNWKFYATPELRSSREWGADFSDSLTAGLQTGISYKVNDRLTIGPGLGILGQIEDSAIFYPILLIDWQLTDSWSLTTGTTIGASRGPGLAFKYDVNDRMRFTFGARAERVRFRLDDSSGTPNGVGEDNSVPVYAMFTWQATDQLQASLIAGVGFVNELVLDSSSGNSIDSQDTGTAPFLGVNLGYTF